MKGVFSKILNFYEEYNNGVIYDRANTVTLKYLGLAEKLKSNKF
jgi:hypothetical protein